MFVLGVLFILQYAKLSIHKGLRRINITRIEWVTDSTRSNYRVSVLSSLLSSFSQLKILSVKLKFWLKSLVFSGYFGFLDGPRDVASQV